MKLNLKVNSINLKQIAKASDMARFLFNFQQELSNIINNSEEECPIAYSIEKSFYEMLNDYYVNIEDLNN